MKIVRGVVLHVKQGSLVFREHEQQPLFFQQAFPYTRVDRCVHQAEVGRGPGVPQTRREGGYGEVMPPTAVVQRPV